MVQLKDNSQQNIILGKRHKEEASLFPPCGCQDAKKLYKEWKQNKLAVHFTCNLACTVQNSVGLKKTSISSEPFPGTIPKIMNKVYTFCQISQYWDNIVFPS